MASRKSTQLVKSSEYQQIVWPDWLSYQGSSMNNVWMTFLKGPQYSYTAYEETHEYVRRTKYKGHVQTCEKVVHIWNIHTVPEIWKIREHGDNRRTRNMLVGNRKLFILQQKALRLVKWCLLSRAFISWPRVLLGKCRQTKEYVLKCVTQNLVIKRNWQGCSYTQSSTTFVDVGCPKVCLNKPPKLSLYKWHD